MIIAYKVRHEKHPEPIQLAGMFVDLEHFKRFQMVEEYRGWFVIQSSIQILDNK